MHRIIQNFVDITSFSVTKKPISSSIDVTFSTMSLAVTELDNNAVQITPKVTASMIRTPTMSVEVNSTAGGVIISTTTGSTTNSLQTTQCVRCTLVNTTAVANLQPTMMIIAGVSTVMVVLLVVVVLLIFTMMVVFVLRRRSHSRNNVTVSTVIKSKY